MERAYSILGVVYMSYLPDRGDLFTAYTREGRKIFGVVSDILHNVYQKDNPDDSPIWGDAQKVTLLLRTVSITEQKD